MKNINYNLKPNEMLVGEDINPELYNIHENFQAIAAGLVATINHVLDTTLAVNTEDLTIVDGSTFEPPIISKPRSITVAQVTAGRYELMPGIIAGFEQNGEYWDILITPITEELTNIQISVI